MLNQQYTNMLNEKDIIFEIFNYSQKRAKEIGAENVYDFSLGNPSVPAPSAVRSVMEEKLETLDPLSLHGYSPSLGIPEIREKIAADLNRRYGCHYTASNIFMTAGAAGALAHALRAVSNPGDEVLTIAPYFPEYKPYTAGAGLKLKVVPADTDTFQVPFEILEEMLTPAVSAILINSPNNPSGIVYSTPTIRRLAEILTRKSEEYGHTIFLISDEPYRDIIFSGTDSPYIANYYTDTITCYSFSKSISLPGERIGYLAVNPDSPYADRIIELCPQISRTTGHNGAASLLQHTVGDVCSMTSELSVYENNKNLLYQALTEYGYHCVEPGGTFYMFPRSPESDSMTFCKRAMEMDLMLVPGDNFGCPGHFRIAYCVPEERVKKALPVFRRLAESYR
ncbi:MAG: pyridoxal phosphate-dependent aminotransferase [Lachnospiraceae bacterium]|nr:pyridoxal phosphate-dependent aminotransferase [Lachnospiraceae bacterium]